MAGEVEMDMALVAEMLDAADRRRRPVAIGRCEAQMLGTGADGADAGRRVGGAGSRPAGSRLIAGVPSRPAT